MSLPLTDKSSFDLLTIKQSKAEKIKNNPNKTSRKKKKKKDWVCKGKGQVSDQDTLTMVTRPRGLLGREAVGLLFQGKLTTTDITECICV